MEKLKKCPWCGETPVIKEAGELGMKLFVCPPGSKCDGSKLFVVFFGSAGDAVKAWNNLKGLNKMSAWKTIMLLIDEYYKPRGG